MKAITIAGRSTKNSEIREKEGRQFATFSLAVAVVYGPNKGVMFFDVITNNTKLAAYITKGKQVVATGELKSREYNGKTYLSVSASHLELMGGGEKQEELDVSTAQTNAQVEGANLIHLSNTDPAEAQVTKDDLDFDDEIPF